MIDIPHWVMWLRGLNALAGLPMMIIGLGLMFGGWRMGKVCIVLTFVALGAGVGIWAGNTQGNALVFGAGGAILFGAVGIASKEHAVALVGALLGTWITMQFLVPLGLQGWTLWVALGLAFLCIAALCSHSRQEVVMIITSFEGAALLVSGLVPVLAMWPFLFRFFESTSRVSWVFFPFMILVPTTVGYFLQIADSKKHLAGAT